jgi:hypothetical protein
MKFEEIIRVAEPKTNLKADIREVLRDVNQQPHVFIRVRLTGWHFPQRALEPFVVIGKTVSRFVLLSPDHETADAYFDVALPAQKGISFGFGKVVTWDFDIAVDPKQIVRLDRTRLPKGHVDIKQAQ